MRCNFPEVWIEGKTKVILIKLGTMPFDKFILDGRGRIRVGSIISIKRGKWYNWERVKITKINKYGQIFADRW